MIETRSAATSSSVYVSEAACEFDDQKVEELASHAAAKNASIGVTGYLYFSKGRFVQCLEGERSVVEELLDRIGQDPRHEVLAVLSRLGSVERRFPKWSMRWVREQEITEIGLEHILADQLLLNSRVGEVGSGLDKSIWRVVDAVADSLHNGGR
ncbi:MAG: BLUF domain-containing protein [Planctomycetota bacterium]